MGSVGAMNKGSADRYFQSKQKDISKLKSIVDYKQRFSLEEGLAKTFKWYKANVFFQFFLCCIN